MTPGHNSTSENRYIELGTPGYTTQVNLGPLHTKHLWRSRAPHQIMHRFHRGIGSRSDQKEWSAEDVERLRKLVRLYFGNFLVLNAADQKNSDLDRDKAWELVRRHFPERSVEQLVTKFNGRLLPEEKQWLEKQKTSLKTSMGGMGGQSADAERTAPGETTPFSAEVMDEETREEVGGAGSTLYARRQKEQPWTPEEDKALEEAILKSDLADWCAVSDCMEKKGFFRGRNAIMTYARKKNPFGVIDVIDLLHIKS